MRYFLLAGYLLIVSASGYAQFITEHDSLTSYLDVGRVEEKKRGGVTDRYTYSVNGDLLLEAHYKQNLETGTWKKYRPGGRLYYEARYKHGLLNGWQKNYDEEGRLISVVKYKKGTRNGKFETYYPNGKVSSKGMYRPVPFLRYDYLVPRPSDYDIDTMPPPAAVRVGKEELFYPNGKPRIIRYYDYKYIREFDWLNEGVKENDKPFFEIRDVEVKTGKWLYLDDKGKVTRMEDYSQNRLIKREDVKEVQ